MAVESFREELLSCFDDFQRTLSTDTGDWTVKGFIDIYRNIYTVNDMAQAIDSEPPYRNLSQYFKWRNRTRGRKRRK